MRRRSLRSLFESDIDGPYWTCTDMGLFNGVLLSIRYFYRIGYIKLCVWCGGKKKPMEEVSMRLGKKVVNYLER
ncbi:hypothetical protein [Rubritalea tangerina]|uniref:hypothetical protein n=1 Tax=Rubritalea tangerina TaxID=430798 RepID=UPI00360BF732